MTLQKKGKRVQDTVEPVRSYQNWKSKRSCLKSNSSPITTYRYTSGSDFPLQYWGIAIIHTNKGDFWKSCEQPQLRKRNIYFHHSQSLLLQHNFRRRNAHCQKCKSYVGHISTLAALIGRGGDGRKDLPWTSKLSGALEDMNQRESLCSSSSSCCRRLVQRNVSASTESNLVEQGTQAI